MATVDTRAAAAEARDLSTVCVVYRMALQARAVEHGVRHNRAMVDLLIGASDATGDLARYYADQAMFLSATEAAA